ncbi:MAG TPA: glycosyltransferase [Pseudonocardiaceae bacterium]
MRIAMVSEHASPLAALGEAECGGQNLHVAELAAALADRGHQVTVYTRQDDPGQPGHVMAPGGYRVVHVPAGPVAPVPRDELMPHLPAFTAFLGRRWQYRRPDVVHAHFWMSGVVSQRAAAPLGVPVVLTYHALGVVKRRHQGAADTSPARRVELERAIGRAAAAVVATCGDEVGELVRLGLSRERLHVVPCGVDCARFRPAPPPDRRPGTLQVLSAGRLVPRKGHDVAIHALAGVPGARLTIVGGPPADQLGQDPEARRLHRLARDLGVERRVRFTGQASRDAMASHLRSADVVACVPRYEPFGLVALEAMASGTPVLASAVGGLLDTVVHRVTGEHVPPGQPEALAAALRRLAGDPVKLRQYGIAARERAVARYPWPQVAELTERVYRRVAAAGSTHNPGRGDDARDAAVAAGGAR